MNVSRAFLAVGLMVLVSACSGTSEDTESNESALAGSVSVPFRLDFGRSDCKSYGFSEYLTIDNRTDESVNYDVRLDFRSVFEVSSSFGNISANRSAQLRVTPKRPIGQSFIAPGDYRETMAVTTNGGGGYQRHNVDLHRVVTGALLEVQPRYSMSFDAALDEETLVLKNEGNETTTVYLATELPFTVERTSVTIFPNSSQRVKVGFQGGEPGTTSSGQLSIRTSWLCNDLDVPSRLTLTGRTPQ